MKKTTKYLAYGACGVLGAALLGIGCQVSPAQAACAYGWELYGTDGEFVESFSMCSGASEDGTLQSKLDGEVVTVNLSNYNGGMIELKGYGSGLNVSKIVFDLASENVIDAGDGIAIIAFVPVEFKGEGTLKMRAALPFLGDDMYSMNGEDRSAAEILKEYRSPNWSEEAYIAEVTINPSQGQPATPNPGESSSITDGEDAHKCPPEKEDDALALTLHILGGTYIVGSLIAFIVLAVKHFGKKKPTVEKTDVNTP